MKNFLKAARVLGVALLAGAPNVSAQDAKLNVVATLPHLASIAGEIGSDLVEVTSLASGRFNPHFISPTPSLMAAARDADLFLEVGMSLELWSERVIDGSRNPDIRVGQNGHAYTFMGVDRIQVPTVVSRVQGDVHPLGNPHIWFDPLNVKIVARNVAVAFKRVDPASAELYDQNLAAFKDKVDRAYFGNALVDLLGADLLTRLARSGKLFSFLEEKSFRGKRLADQVGGWLGQMWSLRGTPFVTYHQQWGYFARAFGLKEIGQLEPKPGIPPTPGHLATLEGQCKAAGVTVCLCAPYYDFARSERFAERIGGTAVRCPTEPGIEGIADWFELIDVLVERFTRAAGAETEGGER